VIGIDLDGTALAKARERASQLGLHNVRFFESDVLSAPIDIPVGRLILQFLSDPAAALRSLATKIKPGGVAVSMMPTGRAFLRRPRIYRCVPCADR
jgi:SAM-dependent methyltransferase